jgi:autotransporter-associated beta strand protein
MSARLPRLTSCFLAPTCSFSIIASLASISSAATIQNWNPGGTGGDGIWGVSPGDKNWNLVAGAPTGNTFWTDAIDDVATFQDNLGGIVTVFDPVQTAGITQSGADYTINAGNITLVQDSANTNPFVDVQAGQLTLDSTLEGSSGLRKLGSGDLVLSSDNLYTGLTSVEGGLLTLTGSLASETVDIASDSSLIDQSSGLLSSSDLSNAGTLTINANDTINSYTQEAGGLLDGTAKLHASNATLNGGEVAGELSYINATSTGSVLVSGSIGGRSLVVSSGTLNLTGTSSDSLVEIMSDAALLDNGDLSPGTEVTNAGTFTVNTDDRVSSYLSEGGLLNGTGTLTSEEDTIFNGSSTLAGKLIALRDATLNGLSTVTGLLTGRATFNDASSVGATGKVVGDFTSNGSDITIGGLTDGGWLHVTGGTLTVTGSAFNSSVEIESGATLIDQSSNALSDLGDITNAGNLILNGAETVASYLQTSDAALLLDITSSTNLDRLVADTVTLDPSSKLTLETSNLTLGKIADIIDGVIVGRFGVIEALAGIGKDLRYSFDPNAGTLQALPGPQYPSRNGGNTLYNLSRNQTQVIGTVFDHVHVAPLVGPGEPPLSNFRKRYYEDTGNPDPALRWEEISGNLASSADASVYDLDPGLGRIVVTPGTQEALMGEAITAFQSRYSIRRDSSGLPVLDPTGAQIPIVTPAGKAIANALSPEVHQGMADFTRHALRAQVRAAMDTTPSANAGSGQAFATFHSASAGANSSSNGADYDIDLTGGLAGWRFQVRPDLQLGFFLGTMTGDLEGALVDTEASGYSLGVFGEYHLKLKAPTTIFSSLSYGSYDYDSTRRSFGGDVHANNIDSSAVEFQLGVETLLVDNDPFRLKPRAALRYLSGDVDGFTESGSGVRMAVDDLDADSFLVELGFNAEFDLNETSLMTAHLGFLFDLENDRHAVSGSYLGGGDSVTVLAPGVETQALVFGTGIAFDLSETFRVGMNWRSEIRDSSQQAHLFNIGGSASF